MEIEPAVRFDDTQTAFSYKSDRQLRKAHFIFSLVNHPFVSALATGAARLALAARLPIKGLIRSTVFEHFCGGETMEESRSTINKLSAFNIGTILDYSVEGEKSEAGFERTAQEILRTIDMARANAQMPFCVFKVTGIGDAKLLEKKQTGAVLTSKEDQAYALVRERVEKICRRAAENNVPVLVDREESWIHNPFDVFADDMMRNFNT